MKNDYTGIEKNYEELINIAKAYMRELNDPEHDINHMNDVVLYTKELLDVVADNIDVEACIIAAYWHDVGRIKLDQGHEKLSADMLKEVMESKGFDHDFINKCYQAILNHRFDMNPTTIEGHLIKDADKLAFIGLGRWQNCVEKHYPLNSILALLPSLKEEVFYFKESKKIYDRDVIKLINFLHNRVM